MIIGIDLDNTIINYDRAFLAAAKTLKMADRAWNKKQLRNKVRQLPEGEAKWQALQKEVYGFRYLEAEIMPGFQEFLSAAAYARVKIFVVSHKTKYLFGDKAINLRNNMQKFLIQKGVLDEPLLKGNNIFFEDSRDRKISRIKQLKCDFFIDDLLEVLSDNNFPEQTKRILLSKDDPVDLFGEIICLPDWYAVTNFIFNR